MYIKSRSWYTRRDGEQRSSGLFCVVLCDDARDEDGLRPLRAFVRGCEMKQCGHFMMGDVRAALPSGDRVVLGVSGTYGDDGLPHDRHFRNNYDRSIEFNARPFVDMWPYAHDVPKDIAKAFWRDGVTPEGVSGAEALRTWATNNVKTLLRWRKGG